MLSRRHFIAASALVAPGIARAQPAWPTKPIRWIVNFPPAGAADILSRTLAEYFGTRLGQPIVVENKPGAGGLLGSDIVAKARGDVHIVMMSNAASHGIGPVLYKDVPYDALADFRHIHLVGTFPTVLAVNGTSPIKTAAELIAQAKAEPGRVTYGSGGNGTMNHLTGQLLANQTGTTLTHIPYRGTALAVADVVAGQVTMVFGDPVSVLPHVKAGRLRALAVTSPQRSPVAPEIPTMVESGYPDIDAVAWHGILAPARTPPDIIRKLNLEIVKALTDPAVKSLLDNQAMQVVGDTPEQFAAFIAKDTATWKAVAAAANVSVE